MVMITPAQRRMFLADLMASPDAENADLAGQYGAFDNETARLGNYSLNEQPSLSALLQPEMSQQQPVQRSSGPIGQIPGTFGPGEGAFQRSGGELVRVKSQPQTNSDLYLDYTNPIDVMGVKGYRLKGDSSRALLSDGRIARLGVDAAAEQSARRAEEEFQLKRAKTLAEIAKLQGGGVDNEAERLAARAKIPGTAEYERVQKDLARTKKTSDAAEATRKYAADNATMLETSLADILGVTPDQLDKVLGTDTKKAQSRVSPAVGVIDVMTPTLFQGTKDIESAIENLKSKAQMFGLANLRKSGVAPGSITEKEWPKFESTLANIDPSLSKEAFVKQLKDIYQQIKSARGTGELDYSELTGGEAPAQPAQSGAQQQAQLMREAEAAIARGAPREAVMRRLQEKLRGQ